VLHRCAALLMLLTLTFSNAETVFGVLRDGTVHHESAASAAVHSSLRHGEHGHEDAGQGNSEQEHGPKHEHGTSADHCTHQHGNLTAAGPLRFTILGYNVPQVFLEPPLGSDRFTEPFSPPPQA
jgi:hypothetical protein